ncbi:putative histone-lysine N-methyltransferase setd3-like isoform X1 [Capsicum annuum]|uniref:uncharacterized protein LOC107858415 n=1 Tax=Capsicum annuum TaxID=4072 RepID=UPI0007BF8887|nr:uncharacterized protein LOC107858415 [Capsicum annuum]KAF3628851.1 putative histone-lysine N-methyltransferase setd3-like isoform X1 [Capsicum annuum]KAF3630949.1 putative histone-lysine N-methyltransferase setd3-like isoform X1 [Capsicum annuum]
MDIGNGWAGPGHTGATKDTTIINKAMMRFRPIAPKPVDNHSGSGSTAETNVADVLGKRRTKRKYVRVKKNTKCKNKKEEKEKSDGSLVLDDQQTVVTLQLLPESSGGIKRSPEDDVRSYPKTINFLVQDQPTWMNSNFLSMGAPDLSDRTSVGMRSPLVVESCVMVDGLVTTTLVDLSALGNTDMEKMMNLECDTCPGFISDGVDNVNWVNLAYRRMIDPLEEGGEAAEMVVRLVVKEKKTVPLLLLPAFACTVRVVYTWNKVKKSRTMPCDVWKMDFGGFAWRFDAKAALCLGR